MKHAALTLLLLSTAFSSVAQAQQQTTKILDLPLTNPLPNRNNLPFAERWIHYQQWYSGADLLSKLKKPVRIIGLQFKAGTPGGQSGTTLKMQVIMAHAWSFLSGNFAGNIASGQTTVLPTTNVVLAANVPGTWVLKINFANDFYWDGVSPVLMDVKIFDNGVQKSFAYDFESTIYRQSKFFRQYSIGNPNATTANSPQTTAHYGLTTRFLYQEGGSYSYGSGCPGTMNFIPVASTNRVPMPGDFGWKQIVTKAAAGYDAVWVLGLSRTKWGSTTLPFPLTFLGGPNCNLLAEPTILIFTKTSGGGPGGGRAEITTPIPAAGSLSGAIVYTQWVVFDKGALNGNLSVTQGLMHVVGG